jgi:hypothetical protein
VTCGSAAQRASLQLRKLNKRQGHVGGWTDVLASGMGVGGLVVDGPPMLEAVGVQAGRWGWLRVRFPFP